MNLAKKTGVSVASGLKVLFSGSWLTIIVLIALSHIPFAPALAVMSAISLAGLVYISVATPSKLTSIAGKLLIITAILSLVTLLANSGLSLESNQSIPRIVALLTGVYFERISPHQQLKRWMFLAIATKIQFILVTTFISSAQYYSVDNIFSFEWWWGLVVMMGFATVLLALANLTAYRVIVWATTLAAAVLVGSFLFLQPPILPALLATSTLLWPTIVERVIGRWVFYSTPKQS